MKVVAPRLPTPVTPLSARTGSRLPDDIVADQVQRLKLFCLVSGGFVEEQSESGTPQPLRPGSHARSSAAAEQVRAQ
jgi:hypothetical protein